MGELWIINIDGKLEIKKINNELGERHIIALKKYVQENNLNIKIDNAIFNASVEMARNDYCIIDMDSENVILFLAKSPSLEQNNIIKNNMHFFEKYPFRYVEISDDVKTYSHEVAITKVYQKIKRK